MKNLNIIFAVFFLLIFFTSCDGTYNYTYQINNESDKEIKVEFVSFSNSDTLLIDVNQSNKILETDHGIEGGNGPHKGEITEDFESIQISIHDSIYAKRDYLDVNEWNYDDGNYTIDITNSDFQ